MRSVAAAALACLAVLPVAAQAKSSFVIKGAGFGHGIGLSQYGAQGAARLGCTYTDILTTYYQGTAVTPATMPAQVLGMNCIGPTARSQTLSPS